MDAAPASERSYVSAAPGASLNGVLRAFPLAVFGVDARLENLNDLRCAQLASGEGPAHGEKFGEHTAVGLDRRHVRVQVAASLKP